jgi:hypothetical protein
LFFYGQILELNQLFTISCSQSGRHLLGLLSTLLCIKNPDESSRKLLRQFLRIPGPVAGLASAGFGVMLRLFIMRFNEVDAVQQRGVKRVNRFAGQIIKIVKATQPVTLLSEVAAATAIAGSIKKSVLRAVLQIDIFQNKQSWIR